MQLSKFFYLDEFKCRDGTAVPQQYVPALTEFCETLDSVRQFFNAPIIVVSGYRTKEHNTKVGGAKASYHMYDVYGGDGMFAVDIKVTHYVPKVVFDAFEGLIRCGVLEQGGLGLYPAWVHYDNRGFKKRWVNK